MKFNMRGFFVEEPCFNDFLEMFEDEELKEEKCCICGNTVICRESIEVDSYICSGCADAAIMKVYGSKKGREK